MTSENTIAFETGLALLPDSAKWLRENPDGPEWIASLTKKIKLAVEKWNLSDIEPAFEGAGASLTFPAKYNGENVVVKIQYPHTEAMDEDKALEAWEGKGAVSLLAIDKDTHTLLMPRLHPGHTLEKANLSDTQKLHIIQTVLEKTLISVKTPFRDLNEQAQEWRSLLENTKASETYPQYLLTAAIDALNHLLEQPTSTPILLNQDLHAGNIIQHGDQWVVIDPKPLIGDKAFAISSIVRSFELGHTKKQTLHRLDTLSSKLSIDRERSRLWCLAQTVAWGLWSDRFRPIHATTAKWLMI